MHRLRSRPFALVALLFAGIPQAHGQEPSAEPSASRYTDAQEEAIDRVDQLSERLRGMPWTPGIVSALSRLGSVACRYEQELGTRIFEKGYSVAAGLDFDLNEEASIHVLSELAAGASKCQPEFGLKSPIDRGESSEIETMASLRATLVAVRTSPDSAVSFARNVAEDFAGLDEYAQLSLVSSLLRLRQQLPAEADAVFQRALLQVATSGSLEDLFTLGNYVFGPRLDEFDLAVVDGAPAIDTVQVMSVPEGRVYALSEIRPGISSALASLYVASSSEMVSRKAALAHGDAVAFGLTSQLAAWAQSNAPRQSPVLANLLAAQRAQLAQGERLSTLSSQLESLSAPPFEGLEAMLDSAPDEPTKALLRFDLACARIRAGKLEDARELVAELEDEIRRPLLDIIDLKDALATIATGDLEAARLGLSTLNDDLHLALAALRLASRHWNLFEKTGPQGDADARAASEAIQLASGAAARVPEHLRASVRLAIAHALALTKQFEESVLALELALQEFNAAPEPKSEIDDAVAVTVSEGGRFRTKVTRGEVHRYFPLLPFSAPRTSFSDVAGQLSMSPETDLDRLEAIVARAVSSRTRTLGLVAVAEGHLARAFERRDPEL